MFSCGCVAGGAHIQCGTNVCYYDFFFFFWNQKLIVHLRVHYNTKYYLSNSIEACLWSFSQKFFINNPKLFKGYISLVIRPKTDLIRETDKRNKIYILIFDFITEIPQRNKRNLLISLKLLNSVIKKLS